MQHFLCNFQIICKIIWKNWLCFFIFLVRAKYLHYNVQWKAENRKTTLIPKFWLSVSPMNMKHFQLSSVHRLFYSIFSSYNLIFTTYIKYFYSKVFWFSWYFIEETNVWLYFGSNFKHSCWTGCPPQKILQYRNAGGFVCVISTCPPVKNLRSRTHNAKRWQKNDFWNRFLISDFYLAIFIYFLTNWVTNLDFLIPLSFPPNLVNI